MKLINRLFRRWLSRFPSFRVGDGSGHANDTFFIRYDLWKCERGAVYLHEFFRSDHDRCLHDHPWPFTTIILRGGYWEVLPTGRVWRRLGYVGRYPAEHKHRIELDPARPKPWSLVFVGRKERAWGFWGPNGWVPWRKGEPNPICETEAA